MNAKHMSYIAALPLSLLATGFAFGQTTPQTQQHPATQQRQSYSQQQSSPYQSTTGTSQTFSELAGQKGYVTRSEAARDSWLQRHFTQCDDNHDNKVNRAEYMQCHRQQGMSGTTMQSGQSQSSQHPQTQQQGRQGQASGYSQSMSNGASGQFSRLAGSKGYVTQSEAAQDPWLQQHFQQCDSNHDGQLTRSEYRQCHGQPMRQGTQPTAAAAGYPQAQQQERAADAQPPHYARRAGHMKAQGQGLASGFESSPQSTSDRPANSFRQLAGSKGYVTQGEVGQDPWLKSHFTRCDDNHDNKVNRAEFRQCRQQFTQNSGAQARQSSRYGNAQQSGQQSGRQAMGNQSNSKFNQLAGSKGYVTQSQAAGDPWLQQHFQQCDSNGDGQLSRAEYQACQHQ